MHFFWDIKNKPKPASQFDLGSTTSTSTLQDNYVFDDIPSGIFGDKVQVQLFVNILKHIVTFKNPLWLTRNYYILYWLCLSLFETTICTPESLSQVPWSVPLIKYSIFNISIVAMSAFDFFLLLLGETQINTCLVWVDFRCDNYLMRVYFSDLPITLSFSENAAPVLVLLFYFRFSRLR